MRQLLSFIVIAAILATGMLAIGYVQTALADKIDCEGGGICFGTQGRDTMIGDDGNNVIFGCGGDDVIIGKDGRDTIDGEGFTDLCEAENQGESGEPGADKIEGGKGDDNIGHFNGPPY